MRPIITEERTPADIDQTIRKLNEEIANDVKAENVIQERIRENIAIVSRLEIQRKVNGTVLA
jgi:hypothetical protein